MKEILGKKIGMTQIYDEAGNAIPVSVVEAGPCIVTQIKTVATDGYNAIQVGFGQVKEKKLTKPQKGHLKGALVKHLREIIVEKPEDFQIGQQILADIFKDGEAVTVSGVSIGKGFAGVVKRHHHHRGPMSHGSKHHRLTGSIGAGTTPGRVYKGRKMSGRMGGENVFNHGLKVVKIDAEKNLILLLGSVPGKPGNLVKISAQGEIRIKKHETAAA